MGAWGTGIFSDDTAVDVRDDWREAILDGLDPEAATRKLAEEHRTVLDDPDEATVFWLALAAAQHQTGRLLPDVRDRALAVIDAGGDVERWRQEGEALARRRAKVLATLADKLRGPQRSPTKLRRPKPHGPGLDVGDIVLIRGAETDARALFVVVATIEAWPPGSEDPVVAALLWEGGDVPSDEEMRRLPLIRDDARDLLRDAGPWGSKHEVSLHGVWNPIRGENALAHYGEVVARGVSRDDALAGVDLELIRHCAWRFLAGWIEGEWFARCVALTKQVAADST